MGHLHDCAFAGAVEWFRMDLGGGCRVDDCEDGGAFSELL